MDVIELTPTFYCLFYAVFFSLNAFIALCMKIFDRVPYKKLFFGWFLLAFIYYAFSFSDVKFGFVYVLMFNLFFLPFYTFSHITFDFVGKAFPMRKTMVLYAVVVSISIILWFIFKSFTISTLLASILLLIMFALIAYKTIFCRKTKTTVPQKVNGAYGILVVVVSFYFSIASKHPGEDFISWPIGFSLYFLYSFITNILVIEKRFLIESHKLKEEVDKRKESERELQVLIDFSSHDLRAPLFNIQGFAKELSGVVKEFFSQVEASELSEKERSSFNDRLEEFEEAIYIINNSVVKMDGIINGLLTLSRFGTKLLDPCVVDMNRLMEHVVTNLKFSIDKLNAEVDICDIPDCYADQTLVDQIFTNLINNSLKYSDPEKKCKISVSGVVYYDSVIYEITDNGIGIAQENQKRIFDVFFREDRDSETKGEGIGLAVVNHCVKKNGGNIKVESKLGVGTTFYIKLPQNVEAL